MGLCESRNLLYVDDVKVETGCMSFAVHDEFLLLTTVKHVCRFIPLHSDPKRKPVQLKPSLKIFITKITALC